MRIPDIWLLIAVLMSAEVALQAQPGPILRVPNTSLRMPSSPPVYGYTVTNAFGSLAFTAPLAITSPPGETNRLFVVEQGGRIVVITNLANPNRTIFLDISSRILGGQPSDERGLLGLAFHPGYATNGYFFVDYVGTSGPHTTNDILARYQVSDTNPNAADTNSEVRFIVQADDLDNHNGGDVHFGPDGYLYLSLGDEGGANDVQNNSQRIDKDFFSGIIRIDVDKLPGSLPPNTHPAATTNYTIPPDNPFIGATQFNGISVNPTNVRTEFWAVGLRNPWRYTFDPVTGFLYCADVGQNAWEEIDIIKKGGNYGWAFREGAHPGPKAGSAPPGFTNYIDPIQEYAHGTATNQGNVVVGGVVYRGSRISQLSGAYIFCDYAIGNIWALQYDGTNTVPFRFLTKEAGIAGFGVDPRNGDVLMANQYANTLRRLVYSTNFTGSPLPATLADTGAFTNTAALAAAPGIVPYDINVPFWSDNAIKTRWFSVPNTNLTLAFDRESNWSFPTGTVWVKHFELQLTNGVPDSKRRLETRLLVRNSTGIYGLTYRWGNSLTNATLVPEEGMDESFVIDEGDGNVRTQVWHYPSRSECQVCHTPAGGFGLGFNTAQMNRDMTYDSITTNQIAALSAAGYFNSNISGIHTLRGLAPATNTDVSLEYRVRSYLAANCVQCHQPAGLAQALWDARISTPTASAQLINGPLLDDFGNTNYRVAAPGSLENSMLLTRISTLDSTHMPPLATSLLNTQAIGLVSAWLTNDLPSYQSFADWQTAAFGSTNTMNSSELDDPDQDRSVNYLEYLTGTDPTNAASTWSITVQAEDGVVQIGYAQIANRGFEVQFTTDLLDGLSWTPLDVVGNEPFFAISNRMTFVSDALTETNRFYRVRVFAP